MRRHPARLPPGITASFAALRLLHCTSSISDCRPLVRSAADRRPPLLLTVGTASSLSSLTHSAQARGPSRRFLMASSPVASYDEKPSGEGGCARSAGCPCAASFCLSRASRRLQAFANCLCRRCVPVRNICQHCSSGRYCMLHPHVLVKFFFLLAWSSLCRHTVRLWRDCQYEALLSLHHPWTRGLALGNTSRSSFKRYVAQDAYFLRAFAKVNNPSRKVIPVARDTQ